MRTTVVLALVLAMGCGSPRPAVTGRRIDDGVGRIGTPRRSTGTRARATYGDEGSSSAPRSSMTYVGEAGDALSSTHTMVANAVVRERSLRGDYFVIRTVLAMDVWELGLTGIPALDGSRAGLRLRATLPIERFNTSCTVRVMVNGVILGELDREDFRLVTPTSREVFVVLGFDQLVQMSQGERVAIRACEEEVRLGPEHRAVFAEFALRMEEEHRWLASPEDVQDLTAVPPADAEPSEPPPDASAE